MISVDDEFKYKFDFEKYLEKDEKDYGNFYINF